MCNTPAPQETTNALPITKSRKTDLCAICRDAHPPSTVVTVVLKSVRPGLWGSRPAAVAKSTWVPKPAVHPPGRIPAPSVRVSPLHQPRTLYPGTITGTDNYQCPGSRCRPTVTGRNALQVRPPVTARGKNHRLLVLGRPQCQLSIS